MGRRQGEANMGSLCSGLDRKWGQEEGAPCSHFPALCQGKVWWEPWPLPWPQPPWVAERKGAARGCCRGSWLEVSGVHWKEESQKTPEIKSTTEVSCGWRLQSVTWSFFCFPLGAPCVR